ncbi:hypothetical protein MASR1M65_18420 [Saprospiraceae bacterium]
MLTLIDYGTGNLLSIQNMFRRIGVPVKISGSAEDIAQADKLILPGVGHFKYGMQQLQKSGLIDVLHERVCLQKVPILGICLGVQLFTKASEKGGLPNAG